LLAAGGAAHLLPTFAMICPLVVAPRERGRHRFDFLATFQGEEIFAYQARLTGRLDDYYRQLRRCVDAAPWKTIAISKAYAARMCTELGLGPGRLETIFPGIELPSHPRPSSDIVAAAFPRLRRDVPIVTYLGRQDTEKGIDLLIYAARMLRDRGVRHRLVVCGGSAFGNSYQALCQQIAHHLAVEVFWKGHVSDELRAALYAHSRCVVYPSIHGEPFGMVAPGAMAYGTPVLVPDLGGIAETIAVGGKAGGISFRVRDTRDLATQLERLLTDDKLRAALSADTPAVAAHFSIEAEADRILAHMGLPPRIPGVDRNPERRQDARRHAEGQ
jgi:glycosyltransferase involved in cell wall biosynthesis